MMVIMMMMMTTSERGVKATLCIRAYRPNINRDTVDIICFPPELSDETKISTAPAPAPDPTQPPSNSLQFHFNRRSQKLMLSKKDIQDDGGTQ